MARSRSTDNTRRSMRRAVRMSPDECAKLDKKLDQTGQCFSEFARQIMLRGKITVNPHEEDLRELIWLLRKGLNNFNQAVKLGHTTGYLPQWIEPMQDEFEYLVEQFHELTLGDESRCA